MRLSGEPHLSGEPFLSGEPPLTGESDLVTDDESGSETGGEGGTSLTTNQAAALERLYLMTESDGTGGYRFKASAYPAGLGGGQLLQLPLTLGNLAPVYLKASDHLPLRMVQLWDARKQPLQLAGSETVTYRLKRKGGSSVYEAEGGIESLRLGVVYHEITETLLPGRYSEEWTIEMASGDEITFPGRGYIELVVEGRLS